MTRSQAPARIDLLLALGVLLVALALRGLYLRDLVGVPFFEHLVGDARTYDAWARRIAGGDWWGDRVFYQAPAYPYFLAVVYRLAGADLWWAHVAQLVLGAIACVFVFAATRLFFERQAALAAGLLAAALPTALYADGVIQKTSLSFFLTTLLLVPLAAFARRPGIGRAAAGGFVLGLLALTRENALVLLAVIPLWMGLRVGPGSRRLAGPLAFTLATLTLLGLVGLRNWSVGDTFALTTSQAGPNFYMGNHAQATGTYVPLLAGRQTPEFEGPDATRLAEQALGRPLTPGEVSRYWFGRAGEFIREQPGRWLVLLAWKTLLTVNAFELPDTEDVYLYADFSPLLRVLLRWLHFGVLLPLAVVGFVLARRERGATLLAALAACFAASVAVFYVVARYRFPLAAFLLPLAGVGVARLLPGIYRGQWRRLLAPALAAGLAAALSNVPLIDATPHRMVAYMNLGSIFLEEGKLAVAERYLEHARRLGENVDLEVHFGVLRLRQGQLARARGHAERSMALAPRDPRGYALMARTLRREGRREEADRFSREAVRLDRTRGSGAPLLE